MFINTILLVKNVVQYIISTLKGVSLFIRLSFCLRSMYMDYYVFIRQQNILPHLHLSQDCFTQFKLTLFLGFQL